MKIPPIIPLLADRNALALSAHAAATDPETTVASAHATDLDGKCPEWVQLIPAGTFTGFDGRGPFRLADPKAVADRSMAMARNGMPIDCGHALEEDGVVGNGAEAAGWITQLEARDGSLWGKVDWTAMGKQKVGGKLFRWLSPVFHHDADGVVFRLARAGLTNRPNLVLKSLNSSQETHLSDKLKAAMSRVRAIFGLPETTDEDAVVVRVQAAFEAEQLTTKVAQALSLPKTATPADAIAAVNAAVTAAKTPVIDPSKYVAMAQFTSLAERLATFVKAEGERVVGEAVKAGKVLPHQKEHFIGWHATDPEGAKTFIEKMIAVVKPGEEGNRPAVNADAGKLTASEKEICANTGVKEADYLKAKMAEVAS